MTISSTRPNRVRSAAASPGTTVDDVSAGVRSVGAGITARMDASGGQRQGQAPRVVADERQRALGELAREGRMRRIAHDAQVRRGARLAEPPTQRVDPAAGRGIGRRVDPAVRRARQQRRLDPSLRVAVRPAEQQVHAGPQRGEDRRRLLVALGDGPHVQRVADGHAAEPEPVAEQSRS